MANNRMWLKNKRTGDKVLLAKYFPSGGWMVSDGEEGLSFRMQRCFFNADKFADNPGGILGLPLSDGGMYGGNDWLIEYEIEEEVEHA